MQYLFLTSRHQGWFGQFCLWLKIFNSESSSYTGHVLYMAMAEAQAVKLNQASTFRTSAHIMSAIVPLAKASYIAKAEGHEARKSILLTVLGVLAKSHSKGCGDIILIRGENEELGQWFNLLQRGIVFFSPWCFIMKISNTENLKTLQWTHIYSPPRFYNYTFYYTWLITLSFYLIINLSIIFLCISM